MKTIKPPTQEQANEYIYNLIKEGTITNTFWEAPMYLVEKFGVSREESAELTIGFLSRRIRRIMASD